MKSVVHSTLLLLLLILSCAVSAQVAVKPQYPGGDPSLATFIMNNIRYPESALQDRIEGRVYVRITIDPSGSVVNPVVTKGINEDFDAEALRLVSMMPLWIPARDAQGYPIPATSIIPISFFPPPERKVREREEVVVAIDTLTGKQIKTALSYGPSFPGGEEALQEYIARNLRKPYNAINRCGSVNVFFAVNTNGHINDIVYPESLDEDCLMALRSLMHSMPRWIPGRHDGVITRMAIGITINFD